MLKPRPHRQLPRHAAPIRAGFTMIEMLVVIGVLMLLIGISVVGYGALTKHNRQKQTQAAMETLRAMVQNYVPTDESLSNITSIYSDIINNHGAIPLANPAYGIHDMDPNTGVNNAQAANGAVFPAVGGKKQSLVFRTWLVMQQLYAVPANRALFERVPVEQRYYLTDSTSALKPHPNLNPGGCFLLADGFGEPILFVPKDGMDGVMLSDGKTGGPTQPIQSDNRLHRWVGSPTNGSWQPPNANPLPFWISAGPDNNFGKGDDNLYSFTP